MGFVPSLAGKRAQHNRIPSHFVPASICAPQVGLTSACLVGPYPEARQYVGAERAADRDVGSVTAARDQHPADAWNIVARVEDVPMAAEERLKPGSEVWYAVRRRHTDVPEVAGTVACRDIHAATEGNGEVRKITADAGPLVKSF